jgi:hypothetical protein
MLSSIHRLPALASARRPPADLAAAAGDLENVIPTSSQCAWFIAVALFDRVEGDRMFLLSRRTLIGVGIALACSLIVVQAQGKDPFVGTWKANVSASTYSPGPPPQSNSRTFEDWGGGLFMSTTKGVNGQGNPTWSQAAFRFDGRDYPYAASTTPGTSPSVITISAKRTDPGAWELTAKVDGKVASVTAYTMSKDGKTYTARQKGTNAKGEPINNVVVWDRQ